MIDKLLDNKIGSDYKEYTSKVVQKHYFLASVFIVIVKNNGSSSTFTDGLVFNKPEYKITNSDIDEIKNILEGKIREKYNSTISQVAINVVSFSYMGLMTDEEYNGE